MDKYESIRCLSFPALAAALGLDLQRFKTRKAGEFYGPCPVHQPKANHTSFSYASDGRFHCFSCGAKGRGAIDLFKAVRNVSFQAAVEALGVLPTLEPPNEKSPATGQISRDTAKQFDLTKYHKHAKPCAWLEERLPDAGVRERYGVFFYSNPARKSAYNNRVMLPVKDIDGKLWGYLGRNVNTATEQSPKYLFPKGLEKSRFLFGAAELKAGMFGPVPLKRVFLVESPFAVLRFAMYGLPAVAAYGWSVSDEQVHILASLARGIIFLPDTNKFGECGSSVQHLAQFCWVRTPALPEGCIDPEQLSRDQILAL